MRNQSFDAAIVRNTCEKIYGGAIHAKTWARWKSWVGATKGRTTKYTEKQFCLLIGVSTARKKKPIGKLNPKAIKAIAYSDETIQMIDALAAHVENEGWALGWDIRSALAVRGYEVSGAFLKKVMPALSPNRWYQVDAVIKAIESAANAA